MKSKKEIVNSQDYKILDENNIFTVDEFIEQIEKGFINHYDGDGYFHDGENETDISVWDESLTWSDVKSFPYVCWYNK